MNKGKKAQKVTTKQKEFNPKNYEKSNLLLRQRRHRDLRRNPITLDNYRDNGHIGDCVRIPYSLTILQFKKGGLHFLIIIYN